MLLGRIAMLVERDAPTLSTIAERIARREISPVEVTAAALERIARYEPELNAFITVLADEALAAARRTEAEIGRGEYRGPLHGVPISLKDLFLTPGIRTTAGSRILDAYLPAEEATVARRLDAAGAILLGKNNMLEFAYGEVAPAFGPSRNPWNTAYGTSGSSSGSAAAVAAGLGYASIGSDTGGSIRLPAAYCGLVGLKPTYGLVSRAGALPLAWSLDHVGPLTRTVRDCALTLEVIAGYDPADSTSSTRPVPRYSALLDQPAPACVIGIVAPDKDDEVTPEVRAAVAAAADRARQLGFTCTSVLLPHPELATRALLGILYPEASAYHLPWLRDRADEYAPNTRIRLELGQLLPATTYLRAQQVRRMVSEAYRALFEQVDILLLPVGPSASYRLDAPDVEPTSEQGDRMAPLMRFTGPFDLIGYPAITVPAGFTQDRLPIGVQLAARPFEEGRLLQVAYALERAEPIWEG
jgi:aspartyl-tRNA(Asn)/glutamyl-tRNA(Gln) amidotransferase subunit A